MSEIENDFLIKLRSTLWTAFGAILLIVIVSTVPFYFNTTNQVRSNLDKLNELKESKADKAIYELTVKQIQKELQDINSKLNKEK